MTRRHITPGKSGKRTLGTGNGACRPDPGDQPGRGPGLSRARPPAPGWARCGSWPGQPRTASTARCTGVRRPPRTAGARAATRPPSAHGPIQLLCWQATRLPPGRVTRCRRARRARR